MGVLTEHSPEQEQEQDIRQKLKEHKNKMLDEITQNTTILDTFLTRVCDKIQYDQDMETLVEEKERIKK